MVTSIYRKGWLEIFEEMRRPELFLSRMFTPKRGSISNSDTVTIDIQRYDESVAVAVKRCSSPNYSEMDLYTTKEFTPPSLYEAMSFDVCDLIARMPGVDPYTAQGIEYRSQLTSQMMKGYVLLNDRVLRHVELQASQILQTGKLNLFNQNGDLVFELDFQPKASHFVNAPNGTWASSNDKLDDLLQMANVIRCDAKITPNRIIMGEKALGQFLNDEKVQKAFDNRRISVGEISPRLADSGATFHGVVWVGNYQFEVWGYSETYTDTITKNCTKYIEDTKVIMMSEKGRLDKVAATVPLPMGPDPRFADLLPGNVEISSEGLALQPNVWGSPDGKNVTGALEARPLLLPVQIDSFGAIETNF